MGGGIEQRNAPLVEEQVKKALQPQLNELKEVWEKVSKLSEKGNVPDSLLVCIYRRFCKVFK